MTFDEVVKGAIVFAGEDGVGFVGRDKSVEFEVGEPGIVLYKIVAQLS